MSSLYTILHMCMYMGGRMFTCMCTCMREGEQKSPKGYIHLAGDEAAGAAWSSSLVRHLPSCTHLHRWHGTKWACEDKISEQGITDGWRPVSYILGQLSFSFHGTFSPLWTYGVPGSAEVHLWHLALSATNGMILLRVHLKNHAEKLGVGVLLL